MNTLNPMVYDPKLGMTLIFAVMLHLILICFVSFTQNETNNHTQVIQVTVATQNSDLAPEEYDFLAQSNQLGSGTLGQKAELATTQVSDFHDDQINELNQQDQSLPKQQAEHQQNQILTSQINPNQHVSATPSQHLRPFSPNALHTSASMLALNSKIASLEAQLEMRRQAYAKRPRRRQLTAVSARASSDAAYMDAWRRRIELVGNLNFPKLRKYGSLTLMVSIRADGSVEQTQVRRSSGNHLLDNAAVEIVRRAAPFDPFPETIKAHTDILEIIRTWKFEGGRVTSQP